jgi:hypothetical protein
MPMPLPVLEKIFGQKETRPARDLEKRLEKLLRDIEKPRVAHPSKFWIAKEVQKTTAPQLLTIPFEQKGEFAIIWAQNRQAYGVMLFAQSQYPTVDHDLWAYTRTKYRGHNIAKLTLAEGIRQLALARKDSVLTAEILIENERTRQGAVRWLKVLGFIASESQEQTTYKRLFMAAYTKDTLYKALLELPAEFQEEKRKMPPMPPDILSKFTSHLTKSFDEGGSDLLTRRRSSV